MANELADALVVAVRKGVAVASELEKLKQAVGIAEAAVRGEERAVRLANDRLADAKRRLEQARDRMAAHPGQGGKRT